MIAASASSSTAATVMMIAGLCRRIHAPVPLRAFLNGCSGLLMRYEFNFET